MALGFGFNKQKVMAAAEKFVQQGKLSNAISEYEKVVKEDPKDLTVLNTIGDLYARVGKNDQAVSYFKKVGDAYAAQGFTVKAIAMYKKLAKLSPQAGDIVLKLAELYTQQGLYNDARQQYVVAADSCMKNGDLEGACKIFQKMLELDPENTGMQSKLADLYVKLGQRDNARNIFLTAAQSLYLRGATDAADEALGRVLALDPGNNDALMMRGQIAADSGDGASAIKYLEKIPDLDSRPDALRSLLRAYLSSGRASEAEPIAQKLVSVHNDLSGVQQFAEAMLAAGDFEGALKVYDRYAEKLLAVNKEALLTALNSSINRIKESPPALELLLGLYRKAGETTHIAETNELLAHAYVQSGELQKAKLLYKELSELEPENPLHEQSYKQIIARLGEDSAARPLTVEEGAQAFMVEELEQGAPVIEQHYDHDLEEAVKLALTDSELYDSYNLPAKALAPLEGVIAQAPRDVRLNQRLAALYARAQNWARGAQCCDILQAVYTEAGHEEQAKQYADMAAKYREKAQAAGMPAPVAEIPPAVEVEAPVAAQPPPAEAELVVEPTPVESAPVEAPAVAEFDLAATPEAAPPAPAPEAAHEIDLSADWESMMTVEQPAAAEAAPPAEAEIPSAQFIGQEAAAQAATGAAVNDLVEEVRFYLSQSMWNEAASGIERCAAMAPDLPALAELRQQLDAGRAAPAAAVVEEPGASVAEFVFDQAAVEPVVEEAPPPPPPPPPP
ncbi:MAG TPA: tetratricopeptide repeat protein, partial [Terriglobales bacterium]|nr:tetratricopeptide repeat protein [Terriglobales bacterium]